MIRKFFITLVLCTIMVGCDALLSENDKQLKVLEKLEENSPKELEKEQEAIIGYCIEVGSVAPDVIDSSCLNVETDETTKKIEFLDKNAQLIKDKSVKEAVGELQSEYNSLKKKIIFFRGMDTIEFVADKIDSIPIVPENELKLLKILNLSYMLGLDLSSGTGNYIDKSGLIILNDDIEYQREKYESLKEQLGLLRK